MAFKAILFLGLLLAVIASPITVDGEPVCPVSSAFGRGSFPDGFLFGAATSAFQVYRIWIYKSNIVESPLTDFLYSGEF